MSEKEKNLFPEERELLRKQLVLLAEQSKNVNLEIHELAELSEQMVAIYSVLQVRGFHRCNYISQLLLSLHLRNHVEFFSFLNAPHKKAL